MATSIPYRNINWLRNLKSVGPTGKLDGFLIASLFDDVSNSQGGLSDSLASLQKAQDALAKVIAALQASAGTSGGSTPAGSLPTTGPANEVLATPNGTAGAIVVRPLVANDIPIIPESRVANLTSDLALKAPLASPSLTGNPTAPTQSAHDNSTKLATTAYADAASGGAVSSVFTRTGAVVAASGDYAVAEVTGAAPLASPALTGTPTAPTQSAGDDSTKIATTAYADSAVAVETSRAEGAEGVLASAIVAETSRAEAAEALLAPLASPALTGSPTAPTQSFGDTSTKIATDAFVQAAVAPVTPGLEVNGSVVVTPFSVNWLVNGIGPPGTVKVNGFPVANRRACMFENPGNLVNQRAAATVYRNNSGYPLLVSAYVFSTTTSVTYTASSDSSPSPTTAVAIGISNVSSSPGVNLIFIVMPGDYYKIAASSGTISVNHWREFICQNGTMTRSSDLAGAGRAVGTVYQNTSTSMLFVSAQAITMTTATILTALTDTYTPPKNPVTQTIQTSVGNGPNTVWFIVPPGHYYEVTAASGTLSHWYEWTWNIPCTRSQDLIQTTGQGQTRTATALSFGVNTGAATATAVLPRAFINDPFLVRWVSVQTSNSAIANQITFAADVGYPPFRDVDQNYQSVANQARTLQGPVMPGYVYECTDLTSGTLSNLHWWEYQLG